MPSTRTVHLQVGEVAPRLDQYLVQEIPDLSRSQAKKLIQQGHVLVSGHPAKPNKSVQPGDKVTVHVPPPDRDVLLPEDLPLDIIYEDTELIVANKPAGMVVHPARGHATGTLVNALLATYPDLAAMSQVDADSTQRPGIVHRLDRDTSGLIVVARTGTALRHLRRQFKSRTVQKLYVALVFGRPTVSEGVIDVPLGRDPRHRQKFAPRAGGKAARTRFRLIERLNDYSLLEIGLETGRTHQIRVHLAWLGCPVVGDIVYGRKKRPFGLDRQFLHAWQLRFTHPRRGNLLSVEAPLDEQLQAFLDQLRLRA
jgi:23S rRNA pseudouridine1911/1915/1917 synthase